MTNVKLVNLFETIAPIPSQQHSSWQAEEVSDSTEVRWLTIPDLTELLGLRVSQVRRLIEDRALLARRVDGVWRVPEMFVKGTEPLGELRGTLVLLGDVGFSDDDAIDWLLGEEDSLGTSPIEALRAGRKAEVRRVAQALL